MQTPYEFFHEAIPVFTLMKRRGIRIDADKMQTLKEDVESELSIYHKVYTDSKVLKDFQRICGKKFNSKSPKHKQQLFFEMGKLKPFKLTGKANQPSTDKESLENLKTQVEVGSDLDLVLDALLREGHLNKLLGTYIDGLLKLTDSNGLIHPSFNLHTVDTYRSSSDKPNFQNIPIRNPILSRVRRTMVPQNDWFIEADFASAEVRFIAIYSGDPVLIKFILDGYDFHRYYASLLYQKPELEISKEKRFDAKNSFVFPTFYGSYYENTSKNLKLPASHVETVETEFWRQFRKTKRWQDEQMALYNRQGYIETKDGFRMQGHLSTNKVLHYPIECSAFHRLLRALLDTEYDMRERNLQSWICGQIHDSIVIDAKDSEVETCLDVLQYNITKPVWDWANVVPMGAEFKIGRNLIDMKEV